MSQQVNDPQFNQILEACLDSIQRQQMSAEECLAQYPDYAEALRELLSVAQLTRSLRRPVMSESAVDELEMRLMARFAQPVAKGAAPATALRPVLRPLFWQRLSKSAAALVLVAVLALGGTGTTIAASASSQPGDSLYEVKRFWESVVAWLASIFGELDEVWLHLARVRYEEVQVLVQQDRLDPQLVDDLIRAVQEAQLYADPQSAASVELFLAEAQRQFETVSLQRPDLDTALLPVRSVLLLRYEDGAWSATGSATQILVETPAAAPTGDALTLTEEPDRDAVAASSTPTPSAEGVLLSPVQVADPTVTPTPTSRFPATATRTPQPTFTVTLSATPRPPDPTETATLTPLPLPGETTSGATRVAPTAPFSTNPVRPSSTSVAPAADDPFGLRATQRAVFMTQTAIAEEAAETAEASP